jgi:4-amino-4-deoxy-L-arabinose transferase-like glycosyltransferase
MSTTATTLVAPSAPAAARTLPLWVLQGVAVYFLGLQLCLIALLGPHGDEAYYWIWGQHPQLSYFDHPPLHAWMQAAVSAVLGWSVLSMRALTFVTTALTLWVFYVWARRLAGSAWQRSFWLGTAVYFATPMMLFYSTVAVHDRVLIVLTMLSVHFFALFFADWSGERRDRVWPLYVGALFLGLAALTKYNAIFLGLGVGLTVLVRRDLRSLLTSPHLYLAALLSVAMQFPTLYWNATEGFASFRFHLEERQHGLSLQHLSFGSFITFVRESAVFFSPVMVIPLWRLLFRPAGADQQGMIVELGKWVLVTSTLAMLGLSAMMYAHFYWNIVAYVVFFAVAHRFMAERWLQIAHFAYGFLVGTALVLNFTLTPFLSTIGIPENQAFRMYGWDVVAARVAEFKTRYDADFVAAPDYLPAALVGFALKDPNVPAITERVDAYDFWFDESRFLGKDAIIVADRGFNVDYVRRFFASVEEIETVEIRRFVRLLNTVHLYIARDYGPIDSHTPAVAP